VFHLITTINRGGAENQLLILVKEQIRQGFEVHVVYLKGEPELEADFLSSGALVHSELASLSPLMQPFKFRNLIRGKNAIVHAHLPRAELVALLTFTKFKFFTSRHNAEPFFPGAPRIVSNFLSRLVEMRSNKIIAISNAVKEFLLLRGEIVNSRKVEVVHYGYKSKLVRDLSKENSQRNIVKLGTISRLTDQKDIPTMLRAFLEYKAESPTSSLSILGAGPLESELKQLAKSLGLSESVNFLGRSSQIYDFLSELDAFILTSKYEGFGMVLLEAMDAGIPVIASRNSAIPEVLGDDFPGLSTTGNSKEFCHKINMLNDPVYRELILNKQSVRLQLFGAEAMSQKISQTYER
jgi:glycosyltransferase involved in cell wall biosynthesis